MAKRYVIQACGKYDGRIAYGHVTFRDIAEFKEGEQSRFGEPFNDRTAKMEAESFKKERGSEFSTIRLVTIEEI